jgi:hypothetical protein
VDDGWKLAEFADEEAVRVWELPSCRRRLGDWINLKKTTKARRQLMQIESWYRTTKNKGKDKIQGFFATLRMTEAGRI